MEYQLRELNQEDIDEHFLQTLRALSPTDIDISTACTIHSERSRCKIRTLILVLHSRVVATASLVPEHKFSHGGSLVYHLEDVAVMEQYQGCGFGTRIVHYAIECARVDKARKIVLECSSKLVGFYEQCGFHEDGAFLRFDISE